MSNDFFFPDTSNNVFALRGTACTQDADCLPTYADARFAPCAAHACVCRADGGPPCGDNMCQINGTGYTFRVFSCDIAYCPNAELRPIQLSREPPGAACDDGNGCTTGTVCDALGACVDGVRRPCDDSDPATLDLCVPDANDTDAFTCVSESAQGGLDIGGDLTPSAPANRTAVPPERVEVDGVQPVSVIVPRAQPLTRRPPTVALSFGWFSIKGRRYATGADWAIRDDSALGLREYTMDDEFATSRITLRSVGTNTSELPPNDPAQIALTGDAIMALETFPQYNYGYVQHSSMWCITASAPFEFDVYNRTYASQQDETTNITIVGQTMDGFDMRFYGGWSSNILFISACKCFGDVNGQGQLSPGNSTFTFGTQAADTCKTEHAVSVRVDCNCFSARRVTFDPRLRVLTPESPETLSASEQSVALVVALSAAAVLLLAVAAGFFWSRRYYRRRAKKRAAEEQIAMDAYRTAHDLSAPSAGPFMTPVGSQRASAGGRLSTGPIKPV